MNSTFKKFSLGVFATLSLAHSASAYNILERATLIDDRFKTLEMQRPYGHNFYIDINAQLTTEIQDLIDDAEKIGKLEGTTTQKLDQTNVILEKYYDKEQVLRAKVGFGAPIFSFNAFDVNVEPNIRVDASLMAVLTPSKQSINMTTVLTAIGNIDGVPQTVVQKFLDCIAGITPSDGDDLLKDCAPTYITVQEQQQIKDAGIKKIPYVLKIASAKEDLPAIDLYAKGEVKGGLWFDYKKGTHFFGTLGIYALGRTDIKKNVDAVLLIGDSAGIEFTENTQINAALDYKLGYKNTNYSAYLALEEIKISEISSEDNGATPDFGSDPLIRLHGQADYNVSMFKMSPYFGLHKRSGYGVADGLYAGANWGMYVWDDRIGLNLQTGLDKEHLTLGLRTKLWLMHLDLTGKFAIADKIDTTKVSNYYSANFRLFF